MSLDAPILYTEAEAAERLRLCPATLRKARQEGRLRYIKYGRAIRYSPDDLAGFIDAQRCLDPQPARSAPPKPRKAGRGKIVPFSKRGSM